MLFPNHLRIGNTNIYRYDIVMFNQNISILLNFLKKQLHLQSKVQFGIETLIILFANYFLTSVQIFTHKTLKLNSCASF